MALKSDKFSSTAVLDRTDIKPPSDYKVILFNDDYTTKEFVVNVLVKVFHKNVEDAIFIMESVHKSGKGIAGIYPYDIAETRREMTLRMARQEGYPLKCELEEC